MTRSSFTTNEAEAIGKQLGNDWSSRYVEAGLDLFATGATSHDSLPGP
jgi:hypothetical protein